MTQPLTYLDYNATAPVPPSVVDAVRRALQHDGNASSVHRFGRLARRLIENAREVVAVSVNAAPEHVIFTSGGTESNHLAIAGSIAGGGVTRLIVSATEHLSVLETARAQGVECIVLPAQEWGTADVERLSQLLAQGAADGGKTLVCVMLANNETGVLQPIEDITRLCHAHGALVLCDGVQGLGKVAIDVGRLGVDMLSLSAHKIGGPQGVGTLVVADGIALASQLRGGGQEKGRRSGTENVPGIAGFGSAAELVEEKLDAMAGVRQLRDELEAAVMSVAPEVIIFGSEVERLPNTSYFALPGMSAETQLIGLDLAGVAVSSGSACSSGKVHLSHVLTAMGVGESVARSAIRVSLGWNTEATDIDRFLSSWSELYRRSVHLRRCKTA